MELKSIVPFGRSFEDYTRMFGLSASDLSGRILGAGDGPAGFNAEATRQRMQVISADPLYAHGRAEIAERIDAAIPEIRRQLEQNRSRFRWDRYATVDELMAARVAAMETFLQDYEAGRAAGRYIEASLPTLPFADRSFDLALVSHFLFLYSAHLSEAFHAQSLRELLRVADEIRVFPLQTLTGEPSPYLATLRRQLGFAGIPSTVRTVNYESQAGATQMLIVRRPARPRWPTYWGREASGIASVASNSSAPELLRVRASAPETLPPPLSGLAG